MEQEKELIARAKLGEEQALEQLILAYEKKVYNLALRMCKNEQDAFDVAQEVFLRVFRSIASFKEESSFSTWIYRIAFNMSVDYTRKNKKHGQNVPLYQQDSEGEEYSLPIPDDSADPQAILQDQELRRAYHRAIGQLPEDQRRILVLRDINGLAYEEIAQALDCNLGTVKSKLNRARNKVRKKLCDS